MKEYRVWDKITKSYSTDQQWSLAPNGKLYYGNAEWENGVVEFATGLKDKNGVMIYEGDVLRVLYNYIGDNIIKFENGKYNASRYDLSQCIVIRNVHDTPQGDNA